MDSNQNFQRKPGSVGASTSSQQSTSVNQTQRPNPSQELLRPLTEQHPYSAQPPRPRSHPSGAQRNPYADQSSSGNSWVKILALGVAGFFLYKGFEIMTGGGMKPVSHEESEASKQEPWSQEFKSTFMNDCSSEASKALANTPMGGQVGPARMAQIGASYCSCMQEKVEAAHVIKTKFETSKISEIKAEVQKAVTDYMNSEEGKTAVQTCFDSAIAP